MRPIGILRSCFKEKFGIPRQAGLIREARAVLELQSPWDRDESVHGLEGYSHIWLLYLFHGIEVRRRKRTVRPPRLGGNQRMGVFATRSPFRPNRIGLSAVELIGIERIKGRLLLRLRGVDLLDGTPVLDIKPYLAFTDSIPEARCGFGEKTRQRRLHVEISPGVRACLDRLEDCEASYLERLLTRVLELDPRPAYLAENPHRNEFGTRLCDYDFRWRVTGDRVTVTSMTAGVGRH